MNRGEGRGAREGERGTEGGELEGWGVVTKAICPSVHLCLPASYSSLISPSFHLAFSPLPLPSSPDLAFPNVIVATKEEKKEKRKRRSSQQLGLIDQIRSVTVRVIRGGLPLLPVMNAVVLVVQVGSPHSVLFGAPSTLFLLIWTVTGSLRAACSGLIQTN